MDSKQTRGFMTGMLLIPIAVVFGRLTMVIHGDGLGSRGGTNDDVEKVLFPTSLRHIPRRDQPAKQNSPNQQPREQTHQDPASSRTFPAMACADRPQASHWASGVS